ncbi:hypothetical protein MKC66_09860 [[Clostridium] innocuum]|nr:hypothetical protein [[Clostridium] innocuum]
MKITHQNVKVSPNKMKLPVDYLKISDPWYDRNVTCRYERDHLQMNEIRVMLKHEHIDVPEDGYDYDYGELNITLANPNIHGKADEYKNYEIGVDTAKYVIETEMVALEDS